ncbi:uncharacterized protein [Pyxicephalus adspersus]|uniref:Uncharacterized protein n=1 Tax=Pyxicephalus adspersus TaxID=30357 RepID=A0AAV3AIR8_PYXAD|nr:TPA: hypothetical protein GDO54_010736 [Pyxicephalus adspersus]
MTFQQFQSICDFYYLLNKAAHWQYEVLDRLSFKDAVWEETPVTEYNRNSMVCISLLWRRQNHALLSQVSPHNPEDWIELARLSSLLPESIRKKGIQISSRLIEWEEEALINIEDLLRRAEAILEVEENVFNRKNISHGQQQPPGYHNSENSTENEGYDFLQKDGCLDSADTTLD